MYRIDRPNIYCSYKAILRFLGSAKPASIFHNVFVISKKSTKPLLSSTKDDCVRTAFYCVAVIF